MSETNIPSKRGGPDMSKQDKTVDLIHQLRSRCQYCTCVGCRCDHKGIEEQAANALEAQAHRLQQVEAIAVEALEEWDYASKFKAFAPAIQAESISTEHDDVDRIAELRAELRALGEDRT